MITLPALVLMAMSAHQEPNSPKVAIFPWTFAENEKGTSMTAVETTEETLRNLFEKRGNMNVIPESTCREAWQKITRKSFSKRIENPADMPGMPSSRTLASFGKAVGADYVCAGRLSWRVRSIWVALGPKTKADATEDVDIYDVRRGRLALNQRGVKSDATKVEKWYETAGALFVTWGITVVSGGPKTPQMQRSGQVVTSYATDSFFDRIEKGR